MSNAADTPPNPPPRAMIDRIASDLADARRAARRETRLRIVVAIAPKVFELIEANSDRADHVIAAAEFVVDALEVIAEPPVEKE